MFNKEISKEYPQFFKNGLLVMDSIANLDDCDLTEILLSDSAIHYIELVQKFLNAKNYRALFRYAIELGWDTIAKYVVKSDEFDPEYESVEEAILNKANSLFRGKNGTISENEKYFNGVSFIRLKDYKEVLNSILSVKRDFLLPIKERHLKSQRLRKVVEEYPKEYFEKLYQNGQREMLVIKLCVLFEAILGYMGFDGSFSEALCAYCERYLSDDGQTAEKLHALRKERNQYVHANDDEKADISDDDLRFCFGYICKLGE